MEQATGTVGISQEALPESVGQLRSFCHAEMTAVRIYERAISTRALSRITRFLRRCQASHKQRVALLSDRIRVLGGDVPDLPGARDSFRPLLGDSVGHEAVALTLLGAGESDRLQEYRFGLHRLDRESQRLLVMHVIPAQVDTHRTINSLKHAFS